MLVPIYGLGNGQGWQKEDGLLRQPRPEAVGHRPSVGEIAGTEANIYREESGSGRECRDGSWVLALFESMASGLDPLWKGCAHHLQSHGRVHPACRQVILCTISVMGSGYFGLSFLPPAFNPYQWAVLKRPNGDQITHPNYTCDRPTRYSDLTSGSKGSRRGDHSFPSPAPSKAD